MKSSVVMDPFSSGVRGQETVRMDLQFVGVECTAAEDMARQEYKLQSDLQYQVTRFGAGLPFNHGEVDFDMDLTKAFALIQESQDAWKALPKVVRDRYMSWSNLEHAAASGELAQLLKTAGLDGSVLPSRPDGSPSDSAADSTPPAS